MFDSKRLLAFSMAAGLAGGGLALAAAPAQAALISTVDVTPDGVTVLVNSWNCYGGTWEARVATTGNTASGPLDKISSYRLTGSFVGQNLGDHFFLTLTVGCMTDALEHEIWSKEIWFDPSGLVVNQYGALLAGAEVSLLRRETAGDGDSFRLAEAGNYFPLSQANPQTTGADGGFQWDVLAGEYRVRAAASGAQPFETPTMTVPPARSGLVLRLVVAGAAPPAPLAKPAVGAPVANTSVSLGDLTWAPGLPVVEDSVIWRAGGVAIGSGHRVTVPAASAGRALNVSVTAHVTRDGNVDGIAPQLGGERRVYTFEPFTYTLELGLVKGAAANPTPAASTLTLKKLVKTPKPVIKGQAKVGKTLKAKAGKWDTGVTKTYRWYAGGKKIKGATKATYKISKKYQGKRITVKVTGKKTGYRTVTKTSKASAKVVRR
jgi:hypothetical protein